MLSTWVPTLNPKREYWPKSSLIPVICTVAGASAASKQPTLVSLTNTTRPMWDAVGAPHPVNPLPNDTARTDTSNPSGNVTATALTVANASAADGVHATVHTADGVADTFVLGVNVTPVTEAADAAPAPTSSTTAAATHMARTSIAV